MYMYIYIVVYIDSTPWKPIIGMALRAIKSIPMIALWCPAFNNHG